MKVESGLQSAKKNFFQLLCAAILAIILLKKSLND